MDNSELRTTVEFWRTKASDIQDRYGKLAPNLVNHVCVAIESCAQDIEAKIAEDESRRIRSVERE